MCEEFIREKEINKFVSVKFDASEYRSIIIEDKENTERIVLSPLELISIIKWYYEVRKELEELNKDD